MNDNIESAEQSVSADNQHKNYNNKSKNKHRNRNNNSANRANTPNQKTAYSDGALDKTKVQKNDTNKKTSANSNRNSSTNNGNRRNNRYNNRNREEYVSKPKSYYMSRPDDDLNYSDKSDTAKRNFTDGTLDTKRTNESQQRMNPGKQVQSAKSQKQEQYRNSKKTTVPKTTETQEGIRPEKQPKAVGGKKTTAPKTTETQEGIRPEKQPKAVGGKKTTAPKTTDTYESIRPEKQPKAVSGKKTTAPKTTETQEGIRPEKQSKAVSGKKTTAPKTTETQEGIRPEKQPKAVSGKKNPPDNLNAVFTGYDRKQYKEISDKNKSNSRKKRKDDFEDISSKTAAEDISSKSSESPVVSEYRKQSDTRFWTRFFSLGAIVPVYAAIVICLLALPRSTVSNLEKRNLDKFPTFSWKDYWSGTYTASIAHYFDDTVPYRDDLKQAGSRLLNLFGIKYNDVQINGTMEVVNKTPNNTSGVANSADSKKKPAKSDAKTNDTDSEEETPVPKGQEIADGVYVNGVIVVHQDGHYRAMSMYGGGSGDLYVDSINSFADDLPGVNIYMMVTPTSSEFYTPLNFSDYNASQSDDIDDMNDKLQNVTGINVCTTLAKHINEPIYTRTDHHWMSLGAYYACRDFAKTANVPFLDLKEYDKKTVPGYVGTFYSFSGGNADLLNDPEDFIYYVPKNKNYNVKYYDYSYNFQYDGELIVQVADVSEMYSSFISGDAYTVKISTGVKNGRRLCLVKDSYGDAIPPFLTGSFEEIYVVDMRYFELNLVDFVDEQRITDVLFSCCTYSAVGPNAENLENLRLQGGSYYDDDTDDEEHNDESSIEEKENDNEEVSEVEDDNEIEEDEKIEDNHHEDTQKEDDDIFAHIDIDDGQVGIVGNINNDFGDDSGDDSGEVYDDEYEEDY